MRGSGTGIHSLTIQLERGRKAMEVADEKAKRGEKRGKMKGKSTVRVELGVEGRVDGVLVLELGTHGAVEEHVL